MTGLDPELQALFRDDPALLQTAARLADSRPDPDLDPRFSAVLRAQLMREAPTILVQRKSRFAIRFGLPAWTAGVGGVVAVAAAVGIFLLNPLHNSAPTFAWNSPLTGNSHVDPNQAITVSFNQPMDEHSVVAALHIEPATAYQTSWHDNTLTITPTHHLVANVPYMVTIDHATAMSAGGQALPADVTLSFGTAPTPTPSPSPTAASTPSLSPTQIGPTDGDVVAFAPNGSLIANGGSSAQATAPPSENSKTAGTQDGLYLYPSSGGSVYLAPRAQAAAVSPDGKHVAIALDAGDGTSTVEVVRIDGTHTTTLTTSDAAVVAVAWQTNSRIEYASATNISTVDFNKTVATAATVTDGNTVVALSLNGDFAALAPLSHSATGELLQVSTGQIRTLTGSTNRFAFSADSKWIGWIDRSQFIPALKVSPTDEDLTSIVALQSAGISDGPLALNYNGSVIAFAAADGNATLAVASVDNGNLLAAGDGAVSALTFDRSDSHLAYATTGSEAMLNVATIPGGSNQPIPVSDIPQSALHAIDQLLSTQVNGKGFTRSYVLDITLNDDNTVTCHALLVNDPKGTTKASETSETITLSTDSDGNYNVSNSTLASPHPWESGPHLVGLTNSRNGTLLTLTFDSDLDPASVKNAISVADTNGAQLPISVRYNQDMREITVVILGPSPAHAKLTVSTSLTDINGQHFDSPYTYALTR